MRYKLLKKQLPLLLLRWLFGTRKPKAPNKPKHIVLVRAGKLGDMIAITPLFPSIKKAYPDATITVVCSPWNEIIIRHNPHVDNVKIINFHSLREVTRLIRWFRKECIDYVFDLSPGISLTNTLILLLGCKKAIVAGIQKDEYSCFYDVVTDAPGLHIFDRLPKLVEKVLSIRAPEVNRPEIYYVSEDREQADSFLDSIAENETLIGINLSAGRPERQWLCENYYSYVKALNERSPIPIKMLLFSYGPQREWARAISANNKNCIAVPPFSFLTIAAIIKKLSLIFTPDTSILHVASSFSVPAVVMYCDQGESFVRWCAYRIENRGIFSSDNNSVANISAEKAVSATIELLQSLPISRLEAKGHEN